MNTRLKTIIQELREHKNLKQWQAVRLISEVMGKSPGAVEGWLYRGCSGDLIDLLVFRLKERYPDIEI